MANWNGAILTNAGKALHAKVEAGQCQLMITKLKTGSGVPAELELLTDLVEPKQNVGISSLTADTANGIVYVKGVISNANLATGYYIKEMGLFASDPDVGEILYAVTTDPNPDYLQNKNSVTVITEDLVLAITISNTENVTALLDPAGLLTLEDLQAHDASATAHDGILEKVADLGRDIIQHLCGSTLVGLVTAVNTNSVFTKMLTLALSASGMKYSLGTNGYICFGSIFGGLILQWGKSLAGPVLLPINFSSYSMYSVVTGYWSSQSNRTSTIGNFSDAQFTIYNLNTEDYTCWFALGK